MAQPSPLLALDLLVRGGGCALLLLLAALLLRDERRALAARLGALFAAGGALYDLCASPVVHAALGWLAIPILAPAIANSFAMWLFARALFDDEFCLRLWHWAFWLALVGAGLIHGFVSAPTHLSVGLLGPLLALQSVVFAVLAGAQTAGSWRGDLVEPRRRLRVFVIAAAAAYTLVTGVADMMDARPTGAAGLASAGTLAAIGALVAWSLLRASAEDVLLPAAARSAFAGARPDAQPPRAFDPADEAAIAALERAMAVDRLYRREGLSIGRLAQLHGLPEYKMRRLINQHLGYRNFADFLNQYRLADAKQALADRTQDGVAILTIALDAGFASLGPFNRAFKAATGMTPSEYRRSHTATAEPAPSSIPIAAGRI
jgi:AraC-like DNA-binding protein